MSMIDDYAERLAQRDADADLAELAARQLDHDFKSLLSQAAGRRVFQSILQHCGTDAASFSPNQADITAFKEGRRDVGLWLTTHLQAHPALYLTFIQEALYESSKSDSSGNRHQRCSDQHRNDTNYGGYPANANSAYWHNGTGSDPTNANGSP